MTNITMNELKSLYSALKIGAAESLKVSGSTVRLVVAGKVISTVTDYNGKYTLRTGRNTIVRSGSFDEAIKEFNKFLNKAVFFQNKTTDIRLDAKTRELKPRAKETKPRKPYTRRNQPEYFI